MKVLHNQQVYELRGNWTKEHFERLKADAEKEKSDNEIMVADPRLGCGKLFNIRELTWIDEGK